MVISALKLRYNWGLYKPTKCVGWNSLALVFSILNQYFYIIGSRFNIPSSGSIGTFLAIICIIIAFLNSTKKLLSSYPYIMLVNILFAFLVTKAFVPEETSMTIYKFVAFALIPMVTLMFKVDFKKVIRYFCYITPTTLIVLNSLFETNEFVQQMQMGYAYALIPLIVANLIQFVYYRAESNWYLKLCNIIAAYLVLRILMLGVRGAVLSLLCAFVITRFTKYNKNGERISLDTWTTVKFILLGAFILIVSINFVEVLEFVADFCERMLGEVPNVITKTIKSIKSDDLSHGRTELYMFTWEAIKEKPFFGHGVLTFASGNFLYQYPHNCILQLLYEVGFIGALYPIVSITYGICTILFGGKKESKDEFLYHFLIFLTAFPMLFLSNEMWEVPAFWVAMILGAEMLGKKRLAV
ncbi:MAG: hypothetical protein UIM24_03080 [Clostridia bacterium]|nr:hypothetical protein [Clostridia bacterium]